MSPGEDDAQPHAPNPIKLRTDYFSIEADHRLPNPVMPYVSAGVILGLYFLSMAALMHLGINAVMDPGGPNLLAFAFLGLGGFAVGTMIMGGFPFRPTYIILTDTELAFRANDSGFMMFGTKVRFSLERPLELVLHPHHKLMDVGQDGEKGRELNLNGLPMDTIFKLLEQLERSPNVRLRRMN